MPVASCSKCEACPRCIPLHEAMYRWGVRFTNLLAELPRLRALQEQNVSRAEAKVAEKQRLLERAEEELTARVRQVAELTRQLAEMTGGGAQAMTQDVSFVPRPDWQQYDLGNGLTAWCRTPQAFEQLQRAIGVAGLQQALADAVAAKEAALRQVRAAVDLLWSARQDLSDTIHEWEERLDRHHRELQDAERARDRASRQHDRCVNSCAADTSRDAPMVAVGGALLVAGVVALALGGPFATGAVAGGEAEPAATPTTEPADSAPAGDHPGEVEATPTPVPTSGVTDTAPPETVVPDHPVIEDDCSGTDHFPDQPAVNAATGEAVPSPSKQRIGLTIAGVPPGSYVAVVVDGPGGPRPGVGQLDDDGRVIVDVPLFDYGPHEIVDVVIRTPDGEEIVVDSSAIGDGGRFTVDDSEQPCDKTLIATASAVPLVASSPSPSPSPGSTAAPTTAPSDEPSPSPNGETGGGTGGQPAPEPSQSAPELGGGTTEGPVASPTTAPSDDRSEQEGGTTDSGGTPTGTDDEDDTNEGLVAGGAVATGVGAGMVGSVAARRRREDEELQEPADDDPTTAPPDDPPPADAGKTRVRIDTGGAGEDSVARDQAFRIEVETPRPAKGDPPETIEVTVSSGDDEESLTLRWTGNATGPATYRSEPLTLEDGGAGGGVNYLGSLVGLEFSSGDMGRLDTDNGETVTVTYDGTSTSFVAYDTGVQQRLGRCIELVRRFDRFWRTLAQELQGVDTPEAEQLRSWAERVIQLSGEAHRHYNDPDKLDTTKVAFVCVLASWISRPDLGSIDMRTARLDINSQIRNLREELSTRVLDRFMSGLALGLYRTVMEATPTASAWTLFTGKDLLNRSVGWDRRVFAALELAGWAALGTGAPARNIASGLTRGAPGTGLQRATSSADEVADAADAGTDITRRGGVGDVGDAAQPPVTRTPPPRHPGPTDRGWLPPTEPPKPPQPPRIRSASPPPPPPPPPPPLPQHPALEIARGVNKEGKSVIGRSTNCHYCSDAFESRWTGRSKDAVAPPALGATGDTILDNLALRTKGMPKTVPGTNLPVGKPFGITGEAQARQILEQLPPGAHARIYGIRPSGQMGHVFNGVNHGGKAVFVDSQVGAFADWNSGYVDFAMAITYF